MIIRGRQSWLRRVGVAAAALATAAFLIGVPARPGDAQGYNSGYTYPAASAPMQGAPGYAAPAPSAWNSGGNPGWLWYPGWGWWSPSWGWWNPGWASAGWGWPGWGWGWGWPVGISVGWGWGGWWGGRGCWNCGFHGGFHGGFAHAGFHGGGFHGGGFHGGGFHR
jgi:hypothetical protein